MDCGTGCRTCMVSTDYCVQCESGWAWTGAGCAPIVVGLLAAALAIIFISLIFGVMIIVRSRKPAWSSIKPYLSNIVNVLLFYFDCCIFYWYFLEK